MSDVNTTKVETPPAPVVPEVLANGVKVYPTSFIPLKAPIEPSRLPTAQMSNLQIEVIHVIIFVLLTVGLFIGMWKRPNLR